MKGCLKVFLLVIVFCFLLTLVLGGVCCYTFNNIKSQVEDNSPSSISERANRIIPITSSDKFKPLKAIDFFGVQAGIFQDGSTKQIYLVGDPGWLFALNPDELDKELTQENLGQILDKSGQRNVEIESIDIIQKGKFDINGQTIPYTQLKATVFDGKKNVTYNVEGVISVLQYNGKNLLFVSGGEEFKYNHESTTEFLKLVKFS